MAREWSYSVLGDEWQSNVVAKSQSHRGSGLSHSGSIAEWSNRSHALSLSLVDPYADGNGIHF